MFSATYKWLPFASSVKPLGAAPPEIGIVPSAANDAVGGRLEDLHVVAGAAADVDRVSARIERDPDEAVRDADRLLERARVQVDDVQRSQD